MRIVQTFWSAGRNPLEFSFGWLRPEYNLMSWALSCLSLRKYYDEVALYTDEQGKHVLIDLLHLPYTEVNVVYDETLCLPQHWAYAKVKTYSLQTKPFLHVDGDIFLTKPIPDSVSCAQLIAQNREIGTQYYKRMMDRILREPAIKLPKYIEDGLKKESIASYNMGIFGGHDLAFIHKFCHEAFAFMENNKMNDRSYRQSFLDCNVFFEQVIFGCITDYNKRDVGSVMGRAICDEGYTRQEFCNFNRFGENKLLHLLGGHKRNKYITRSFEKFMLIHHLGIIENILELVYRRNKYNCLSRRRSPINDTIYRIIPDFEEYIARKLVQCKLTGSNILLSEERERIATLPFHDTQKLCGSIVKCTTDLSIYELPKDMAREKLEKLKILLECEPNFPLSHIVVYPSIRQDWIEVVPIEYTCFNILVAMENKEIPIEELQYWVIKEIIGQSIQEPLLEFTMQHLKYLINTGTLVIRRNNV